MVQLLLNAARALGQAGECPKEVIFSGEGFPDNRADFYSLLSPENIDWDNLPSDLRLTRDDMAELARRFDSLLRSCQRQRILFDDPRGTGVNLAARLSAEQAGLLQSIMKRLALSYGSEELVSGAGMMFLSLDLLDLFGIGLDNLSVLYLNFQEGCLSGLSPLSPSLEEARLAIESELSASVLQILRLSSQIWWLAHQDGIVAMDNPWLIKINLRAELSLALKVLCGQLINLLVSLTTR
ncbi:MAG: hypothetical protein NTY61_01440, partial [Candidatus Parcubacteria bacterium]|nr:hypothetical protein [Candidatus Parcubacteria bacterium]